MKITNKNFGKFVGFIILFGVVGTLFWDLLEIIINSAGLKLSLTAGPVGFDIDVLSVYLKFNPGTLLGLGAGWFIFRKI